MANISESPRLLRRVNSGPYYAKIKNERQVYSQMARPGMVDSRECAPLK